MYRGAPCSTPLDQVEIRHAVQPGSRSATSKSEYAAPEIPEDARVSDQRERMERRRGAGPMRTPVGSPHAHHASLIAKRSQTADAVMSKPTP
jgi:hypothetical protein